jgi:hypothetical protein
MSAVLIAMLGVALSNPIERPETPPVVVGECAMVYPITRATPLPPKLISPSGSASCSAVAVPLSQYADLLQIEKWGKAVSDRYRIDTAELTRERDWYKAKLEEESEPPHFLERPGTQRWFGRLETLVTVGVVAVGLGAAYNYGSGGLR